MLKKLMLDETTEILKDNGIYDFIEYAFIYKMRFFDGRAELNVGTEEADYKNILTPIGQFSELFHLFFEKKNIPYS